MIEIVDHKYRIYHICVRDNPTKIKRSSWVMNWHVDSKTVLRSRGREYRLQIEEMVNYYDIVTCFILVWTKNLPFILGDFNPNDLTVDIHAGVSKSWMNSWPIKSWDYLMDTKISVSQIIQNLLQDLIWHRRTRTILLL